MASASGGVHAQTMYGSIFTLFHYVTACATRVLITQRDTWNEPDGI